MKNASFIQMHFEKIVFGVVALVALIIIASYVFSKPVSPFSIEIKSQSMDLGDAKDKLQEVEAQLKRTVEASEDFVFDPVKSASDSFDTLFENAAGSRQSDEIIARWGRAPIEDLRIINIVSIDYYVPENPALELENFASHWGQLVDIEGASRHYVSVSAKVDLSEWHSLLRDRVTANSVGKELLPAGTVDNAMALTGVFLYRQEKQQDGNWSDWQQVEVPEGQLAYGVEGDYPNAYESPNEVESWLEQLKKDQEKICRISDYPVLAGSPKPRFVPQDDPNTQEEEILPAFSTRVDEVELSPVLIVNTLDVTAQPGKEYRYTVRLGLVNPLYDDLRQTAEESQVLNGAQPTLMTALDTRQIVEVNIPLDSFFFVVGGNADISQASIELWRRIPGRWEKKLLDVRPGFPAGEIELVAGRTVDFTTGYTVVDVLETSNGIEVLFQDANGQLLSRRSTQDLNNSIRAELQRGGLTPPRLVSSTQDDTVPNDGGLIAPNEL